MVFILMRSEELGEEYFEYPDMAGAKAGWERMVEKIHKKDDGIERTLMIVTKIKTITSGERDDGNDDEN